MSVLDQIKRNAKRIKKDKNIKHHEALELASKLAGFSNFKEAQVKNGHFKKPSEGYVALTHHQR